MISHFLIHHKRGCPANKGQDCVCGLFEARRELKNIRLALQLARPYVNDMVGIASDARQTLGNIDKALEDLKDVRL